MKKDLREVLNEALQLTEAKEFTNLDGTEFTLEDFQEVMGAKLYDMKGILEEGEPVETKFPVEGLETISEEANEAKFLNHSIQDFLGDIDKSAYKFEKNVTQENALVLAWEANRLIERLETLNYMVTDKIIEIEQLAEKTIKDVNKSGE